MGQMPGASTYILGHADPEVQRLSLRARLYQDCLNQDCTEHAAVRGRLATGDPRARCGPWARGCVVLAARLVGRAGSVLGVVSAALTGVFRAAKLNPTFGTTLHKLFQRAGLDVPRLTLGPPVGGAENADLLASGIEVWRLKLPVADAAGRATNGLAEPDLLLARLPEEIAASQGVVVGPPLITASARRPAEL